MYILVAEIIDDCIDNLDVAVDANPKDFMRHSYIDEIECIAMEAIPADTDALLRMAINDWTIATDEPTHELLFDGATTPMNLIATNILEQVINALTAHFNERHRDRIDQLLCCVCGEYMNNTGQIGNCYSCSETIHIEHVSINGFCPLCKSRFAFQEKQ
jgi:hypothetical protein